MNLPLESAHYHPRELRRVKSELEKAWRWRSLNQKGWGSEEVKRLSVKEYINQSCWVEKRWKWGFSGSCTSQKAASSKDCSHTFEEQNWSERYCHLQWCWHPDEQESLPPYFHQSSLILSAQKIEIESLWGTLKTRFHSCSLQDRVRNQGKNSRVIPLDWGQN